MVKAISKCNNGSFSTMAQHHIWCFGYAISSARVCAYVDVYVQPHTYAIVYAQPRMYNVKLLKLLKVGG